MVDVEELRKWRYAEPFRPFELILDDGHRFLIKHPWNIGWSEKGEQVAFASGGDNVDIVSFSRVAGLKSPRKRRTSKVKSTGKRGRR
jgi:hypothetical protein